MATDKPRITITLEPDQHETLERLAKLQQRPMSAIIRELIGEVVPILARVADALEVAQRASSDLRANFVKAAADAEAELRPIAEFARSQFDMFASEMERAVDGAKAGAALPDGPGAAGQTGKVAPAAASSPRPVITGATDSQRGTSKGRGRADRATSKGASRGAK